jgi:uncharacterized phage protein (TIGR02218 family)
MFKAEMRTLMHYLNQVIGRTYSRLCDTDLGSSRCTVDLTDSRFRTEGAVRSDEGSGVLRLRGVTGYDDGWFNAGKLTFTTGANAGVAVEVGRFTNLAVGVEVVLWELPPHDVGRGDELVMTAGCDKKATTCIAKFDNIINFQGCHLIPGNNFLQRVGRQGGGTGRGESLFINAL